MLRGPSGCGKTTLLNILGTIDRASSGEIRKFLTFHMHSIEFELIYPNIQDILGDIINPKSSDSFLSGLRLKKIGFVFQTFNLLAALTVTENVELPMRILGNLKDQEIKQRCKDILTRVGLHERMLHLVIILP